METDFWNDILTARTAGQPADRDAADPADLVSFISNSYQLDVPLIDTSSPNIQRWLGGGTSAAVHLFRLGHKQDFITGRTKRHWHLEADREIAIKRPTTLEERVSMRNELRILSHPPLREHENITDILGWSVKADRWSVEPLLIVEASTYGDLTRFLGDGMPSSVEQATSISVDLTRGLHALHSAGVIHGDIKTSNILLFANSKDPSKSFRAKICDFGFSPIVSDHSKSKDRISLPRSVPYNAPECKPGAEILLSEAYQADVFSYGMVLWDIWSHGFVLRNDECELESKKQGGKLANEIQQSIKDHASLDPRQEAVLCNILNECLEPNPQQRIRDVIHLLPELYAIASSTRAADKDNMPNRSPIDVNIVPGTNKSESFPKIAPIPANGDELVNSTITFGRRIRSTIVAELEARATSGSSVQLFAVHYLLSFCYLTGYGTDTNLPLAIEHMARSARSGSVKALSMIRQYCRALNIMFPAELLGLSERETHAWTAAAGYPHPPTRLFLSVPDEGVKPHSQISILASEDLVECWKKFSLTSEKLHDNRNKSIAVILERRQQVKELESKICTEDPDIRYRDNDGNSLLHYACFLGNVKETLRLLEQGAKPFASQKGITPLHWLSQFPTDSLELISSSLIEHGAEVNAVSVGGGLSSLHPAEWFPPGTPLSWAVFAERKDVVSLLLSHGADPHLPGFKSALGVAANYHEYEILEYLLNVVPPSTLSVDRNNSSLTLLEWAIESRSLTDRIVRHGERYKTAAARTIRLLVERRVDVSVNASTALRYSITRYHSESNIDIIQCLLENGSADPAVLELEPSLDDGLTPLHCAMANSGRAMFKTLIKYGADVNHAAGIRRYTCLHGCSRADPDDAVYFAKVLLEMDGVQEVDLEAKDIDGYTPFMLACRFQRTELARYLFSKGADAYVIDNEGYTVISSCLSKSAFASLQDIIPDLTEHDYICHPGMGVTALHHVTEWDEATDAEALVLLGEILRAAPHLVNKATILNGRTGLFSAVRRGNVQMVKMLLENGANINIRDGNGMTSAELASGMYLASVETGQEARAIRMATVCAEFYRFMNAQAETTN